MRRKPLSGYTPYIPVSGDFREAFNIFAGVSYNPNKPLPCFHGITINNGTSETYVEFIKKAVEVGWLVHDDIIIKDNARVHTGGAATDLEDWLWDHEVDGRPLRILVLYLPTRSPELNPIELIFHVLSRQLKSERYSVDETLSGTEVRALVRRILNEIDVQLVANCVRHCGYNVV